MGTRESFFGKGRGWMHNIWMACMTYILIFIGLTAFANKYEVLGPITSIASYVFGEYISVWATIGGVIVYLINSAFWGFVIELLQGQFFGVEFSKSDVISTISGVPVALLLYAVFPQNIFVFIICSLAFLGSIVYAIWYLKRYLNRRKSNQ